MKKVKFRSLKELYEDSKGVLEPKVSPVSEGSFRWQMPADDPKCIAPTNRGSCRVDRSSWEHLPTHHSPRLHSEGTTSQMGIKADYELSVDTAQEEGLRQFIISDTDLISPVSSICNGRRSSSETSNLVSVCSNHDSQDVFEATEMLGEMGNLQTVADNCHLTKVPTFDTFDENQKNSGLVDNWKESDRLFDDTSCISRSHYTNKMDGDLVGKNLSCSSASLNSFSINGNNVDNQPCSCCQAGSLDDVTDNGNCRNPVIGAQEFSKPISLLRNQSDLSENSSLRNPYSGATSLKVDSSDCPDEQVESTLERATLIRTDGQRSCMHSFADSMKPNTKINWGHSESETRKLSGQKELLLKFSQVFAKHSSLQPRLQSEALDSSDGMGILEREVKICNICGHPGCEELLAVCCKCSGGAEHIYCMCENLKRVPEGTWMCEECMMMEEVEKQKQDKFERPDRASSEFQNSGNSSTSNHKGTLELEAKSSIVEKSGKDRGSSSPRLVEKRPNLSIPVKRARTLRIDCTPSSMLVSQPKTILCRSSLFNSLDKRTVKPDPEGSVLEPKSFDRELSKVNVQLSNDHLQRQSHARENDTSDDKREGVADMFSEKNTNLSNAVDVKHKGHDFANIEKKLKVTESRVTTTVTDSGISDTVLDKRPALADGADSCSPLFLRTTDSAVKAVQCYEKTSNASKCILMDKRTAPADGAVACSPLISRSSDSAVKASQSQCHVKMSNTSKSTEMDKRTASADEADACAPHLSGPDYSAVKARNCQEKTSNTSKSAGKFGEKCSPNKKHKSIVKDETDSLKYSKEAAFAAKVKPSEDTSLPDGSCHPRRLPEYAFAADDPFWISAIPKSNYTWKGGFQIQVTRRGVGLSRFCNGIKAHLATGASPRVLEAVGKLPQTLLLEEVPRLSLWPAQFLKNQETENTIALYFFAQDLTSFASSYRGLVENMIKNDVGLKGNFNGTELLVFSYNLLPEGLRRWSNFSFLWGVFRGGRVNIPEQIPIYKSNSNFSQENKFICLPSFSPINNSCFPGQSSEISLSSNLSSNVQREASFLTLLASPVISYDKSTDDSETKSSLERKLLVPEENPDQKPHMVKAPTRSEQLSQGRAHSGPMQREETGTKGQPHIDLNLQADEECNLDTECKVDERLKCENQGPKLQPVTQYHFLELPLISGSTGDTRSRDVKYPNLLTRNQNNHDDDDNSLSLSLALPMFCKHSDVDAPFSFNILSRK